MLSSQNELARTLLYIWHERNESAKKIYRVNRKNLGSKESRPGGKPGHQQDIAIRQWRYK